MSDVAADKPADKAADKPTQVTVKDPRTGDVRVIPSELAERYAARGFETVKG